MPAASHVRILLVDEDPLVLSALSEMLVLRLCGVEIQKAQTPREALECLRIATFDIVIASLPSPPRAASSYVRALKDAARTADILIIAGVADQELFEDVTGQGAAFCLTPVGRDALTGQIRSILRRRTDHQSDPHADVAPLPPSPTQ